MNEMATVEYLLRLYAGDYNNVFVSAFVSVPKGCCATVSVENISTQAITVQNANLIVERVA